MLKQDVSQADIAETFSKTLFSAGWVAKGHLLDENRWGIDVLFHKRESGKMMFHFITHDLLEINLEFDLVELNKLGRTYVDSRIELLVGQANAAREERMRDQSIFIGYGENKAVVDKALIDVKRPQIAEAIKMAHETGESIH